MNGEEVRKMTSEEIDVELKRLRGKIYLLRTQSVTEKIEDNSGFAKARKDIARLLTERSARSRKADKNAAARHTGTRRARREAKLGLSGVTPPRPVAKSGAKSGKKSSLRLSKSKKK